MWGPMSIHTMRLLAVSVVSTFLLGACSTSAPTQFETNATACTEKCEDAGNDQAEAPVPATPAVENQQPTPMVEVVTPKPVNDLCPIECGVAVEGFYEQYCGHTIGFCSDECRSEWQKLEDEQRTKLIGEAMKRSGRTWSPKN